jgi:TPP-dependent pyruvate/acetoin dehydrogenase alpha subunit
MTEELSEEIEAALEAAAAAPVAGPEDLFKNIYEHSPQRVLRQRAELLGGQPG